jgi:hypothetical protein
MMRSTLVVMFVLSCKSSTPDAAAPAPPSAGLDASVTADAPVVDAAIEAIIDAPSDAPSDAPIDAAIVDAAITAPAPKVKRSKKARQACLAECTKRNRNSHCASDEGMVDCPCRCD